MFSQRTWTHVLKRLQQSKLELLQNLGALVQECDPQNPPSQLQVIQLFSIKFPGCLIVCLFPEMPPSWQARKIQHLFHAEASLNCQRRFSSKTLKGPNLVGMLKAGRVDFHKKHNGHDHFCSKTWKGKEGKHGKFHYCPTGQ